MVDTLEVVRQGSVFKFGRSFAPDNEIAAPTRLRYIVCEAVWFQVRERSKLR